MASVMTLSKMRVWRKTIPLDFSVQLEHGPCCAWTPRRLDKNRLYCYVLHRLTYCLSSKLRSFCIFISLRLLESLHLTILPHPSLLPEVINNLHPGAHIHHMARSFAFRDRLLRARFIATWSPPSRWSPPLETSPSRLLFHSDDKTNRLKVCRCCRDLNQLRQRAGDYYKIVDSVWPEDIGQLVLL